MITALSLFFIYLFVGLMLLAKYRLILFISDTWVGRYADLGLFIKVYGMLLMIWVMPFQGAYALLMLMLRR